MYICMYVHFHIRYMHALICVYMCCKGLVFQTIKSFVCAQGASLQTTEKAMYETFLDIYLANLICRRW